MPLRVDQLYKEPSHTEAAFAVASLLAVLALATLGLKTFLEWRQAREFELAQHQVVDSRIVDGG
jgi:sulfate transport system permease protein